MRIVTARVNHETNTFSPVPTPLESFTPRWGAEARTAAEGSPTPIGAFVDFAIARGATVDTPVFAHANPSGPVDDAAFEAIADAIVQAAAGADAVLLDLHGAMVTESLEDGEGELVARVRAAAGDVPIGVALDLHGNISARLVDVADVIVGFATYPHVDLRETGERVARIVGLMLDEGLRPAMALAHPPMLAHTLCMNTFVPGAMREAVDAARTAETGPVLAATIFGGFPLSDIADAGASAVVVAEDAASARASADALADLLWARRDAFVYREEPPARSLARAKEAAARGRVLLLDHGDNCMSGGTCDTMDVITGALEAGLSGILAGPIADAAAVDAMTRAGVGAIVTLPLGNVVDMPLIGDKKPAPVLTGRVAALGDGRYVISGPTYTGMTCEMGRTAVLDVGAALILVSERPHEPWDLGVFTQIGLHPSAARVLILKSRMYARPVFEPLVETVIECASHGVTSSDPALFRFRRLPRPIYPLDPDTPHVRPGGASPG